MEEQHEEANNLCTTELEQRVEDENRDDRNATNLLRKESSEDVLREE